MLKPILMGVASCAKARADPQAGEITAAPIPALTVRRVRRWLMFFLHKSADFSSGYPGRPPRGHDPAVLAHNMPCFDKPEKRAAAGAAICANGARTDNGSGESNLLPADDTNIVDW